MIKCIASDLDGTLLPPSKIMPDEIFRLIKIMGKKGITFVPASGRQLPNLQKLFAPALDDIAIIAENGGIAWHKGKIIYTNPTPADDIIYALDIINSIDGIYPLLSGVDCAYYDSDNERFITTLNKSYSRAQRVTDLAAAARNNTILKISVWDEQPAADHAANLLIPRIKDLRTKVSGYDWLDVSVSTANKGEALKALLKELGADKSECVAFGDHMNDLEMLQASGYAFVTANGFPELKKLVPNIIPSNAEYGVIQKIKEFI